VHEGDELMRVADPTGAWQLELHMPENRMGHITDYQLALCEKSREKLRELLREETRHKMGDAATDEDVGKAVEAELARVSDEELRDKIVSLLHNRLRSELQPILNGATDESLRAKLDEVLRAKTYDDALAKLGEVLPEVSDADLKARLQALADSSDVPDDRLNVTYILALEPSVTHKGKILEVHRSAEVRGDEGNTVLIKVELDEDEMNQLREQQKLRQGAAVTAKIHCGKRPLGYVLLHDVIEFIQSRVLFRFF